MIGRGILVLALLLVAAFSFAQSPAAVRPDISGSWGPYRAARGADPKLAPPPAGPIVLKGDFAKRYAATQAADAEATRNGQPIATPAVSCIPYGVPTMMSVAVYPVEIIATPKQVTIVGEAFSEVRRIYMDKPQEKIEDVPPVRVAITAIEVPVSRVLVTTSVGMRAHCVQGRFRTYAMRKSIVPIHSQAASGAALDRQQHSVVALRASGIHLGYVGHQLSVRRPLQTEHAALLCAGGRRAGCSRCTAQRQPIARARSIGIEDPGKVNRGIESLEQPQMRRLRADIARRNKPVARKLPLHAQIP